MSEFLATVDFRCYRLAVDDADNGEAPRAERGLPERRITVNQLVAYNMAHFRKAAGMSQEHLGERLGGWSNAAVSAAERSWDGKRIRQFDADVVAAIALALGVPVIALLLPPPDAGIAVRYLLDSEPGHPDVTSLLPRLTSLYGDAPALGAFWDRVLALGASRYMDGADPALAPARQEADQLLARARREAERLEMDAKERTHEYLDELVQARVDLERRVDNLRAFEKEYRLRLLEYLEGQVADLKAGDYDDGVFPDPPPARPEGRPI